MRSIGRNLWGDTWALMFIMLGMSLACFVSAFVYSSVPNFWFGTIDLYMLVFVALAQNSKVTGKQAVLFYIAASIVTFAILAILVRL